MITIVDDVTLIIEDLNGKDYKVHATTVDSTYNDDYTVYVYNLTDNTSFSYHCDSAGNFVDDDICNDDVASAIHDELMTVIKGF